VYFLRKMRRHALFCHPDKPAAVQMAIETQAWLKGLGMKTTLNGFMPNPDGAVSYGGDGYVLDVANQTVEAGYSAPLARVNYGTSGFLTNIEPDQVREKLTQLMEGQYVVETRSRLEVQRRNPRMLVNIDTSAHALNDIVIERTGAKTIHLTVVYGPNKEALEVWGDGIIVATRTGSTAYNRVLGGPIILKENLLVLKLMGSAVENHNAYVLPIDTEFEIRLPANSEARIAADGKEITRVENGDIITVRAAAEKTHFIEFGNLIW
jgi:NAD+ kinase